MSMPTFVKSKLFYTFLLTLGGNEHCNDTKCSRVSCIAASATATVYMVVLSVCLAMDYHSMQCLLYCEEHTMGVYGL
jgi:hypothetical protein